MYFRLVRGKCRHICTKRAVTLQIPISRTRITDLPPAVKVFASVDFNAITAFVAVRLVNSCEILHVYRYTIFGSECLFFGVFCVIVMMWEYYLQWIVGLSTTMIEMREIYYQALGFAFREDPLQRVK